MWTKGLNQISTKALYEAWVSGTLDLSYSAGMQTDRESEALEGALPIKQNTPQICPYGLYAEQISGTSFTTPRNENMRTWIYKILPSVKRSSFQTISSPYIVNDFSSSNVSHIYKPNL